VKPADVEAADAEAASAAARVREISSLIGIVSYGPENDPDAVTASFYEGGKLVVNGKLIRTVKHGGETASLYEGGRLVVSSNGGVYGNGDGLTTLKNDVVTLEIQNGVTGILSDAFEDYKNLTLVTIPKSVEYIGACAFRGCEKLATIYVAADNVKYAGVDGVLYSKGWRCVYPFDALIKYPIGRPDSVYTIPNSVRAIEACAFENSKLKSVTIPSCVKTIEERTFENSEIESVTILNPNPPRLGKRNFGYWRDDLSVNPFVDQFNRLMSTVSFFVPRHAIRAYKHREDWEYEYSNIYCIDTGSGVSNADNAVKQGNVCYDCSAVGNKAGAEKETRIYCNGKNYYGAEYKKRFGTPMSYFQNTVKYLRYSSREDYRFLISGPDLAEYSDDEVYMLKHEISVNDWLDILHALGDIAHECADKPEWRDIDAFKYKIIGKITYYPSAWGELDSVMAGIRKNIRRNLDIEALEKRLAKEYKKMFGERISEEERSIMRVTFADFANSKYIVVKRAMNGGAVAVSEPRCWGCLPVDVISENRSPPSCQENCRFAELDIGEWLSFVRELHRIPSNSWVGFSDEDVFRGSVEVSTDRGERQATDSWLMSDRHAFGFSGCTAYRYAVFGENENYEKPTWRVEFSRFGRSGVTYSGVNAYPPNWEQLILLMSKIEAKVNTPDKIPN